MVMNRTLELEAIGIDLFFEVFAQDVHRVAVPGVGAGKVPEQDGDHRQRHGAAGLVITVTERAIPLVQHGPGM